MTRKVSTITLTSKQNNSYFIPTKSYENVEKSYWVSHPQNKVQKMFSPLS
jgi:hypothetical protein